MAPGRRLWTVLGIAALMATIGAAGALLYANSGSLGEMVPSGLAVPGSAEDTNDTQQAHAGHSHDHRAASAEDASAPADQIDDSGTSDTGIADVTLEVEPSPLADEVPKPEENLSDLEKVDGLTARGDTALEMLVDEGYATGTGTTDDPIVIEGLHVTGDLHLQDTTKAVVIQGNDVDGQLKLNYIGYDVLVRDNEIHDLRVNENVDRTGYTTTGHIQENDIGIVGQLRHWAGTFQNNTVGPVPDAGMNRTYEGDRGENRLDFGITFFLDGYHQGKIIDNTIHGPVRVQLHGHFHGSCYECPHHEHVVNPSHGVEGTREHNHAVDQLNHTDRWHSLIFARNTLHWDQEQVDEKTGEAKNWAMSVVDWGHQTNDKMARSEKEESLQLPHSHSIKLRFEGNTFFGSQLVFSQVPAVEELHVGRPQDVSVVLKDNHVEKSVPYGPNAPWGSLAFNFWDVRNLTLKATENSYTFNYPDNAHRMAENISKTVGFRFGKTMGTVHLEGTSGSPTHWGVFAGKSPHLEIQAEPSQFEAYIDETRKS